MEIKAIAFDLGNVLFSFDYTIALKKIEGKMEATVKDVIRELYINGFALPFEKGIVSAWDFYLHFKDKFLLRLDYDGFVDAWCEIFFPKKDVIELVDRLRVNYPVYLISNINELHFKYLYDKHRDVFSLFQNLILSFEVKSIKPEKRIFDILSKIIGHNFQDILYIDDRIDLIEESSNFGLQSIRFIGYNKLISDLKKYNLILENF